MIDPCLKLDVMSGRRFTVICELSSVGAFLPTFSIQISNSVIFELLQFFLCSQMVVKNMHGIWRIKGQKRLLHLLAGDTSPV